MPCRGKWHLLFPDADTPFHPVLNQDLQDFEDYRGRLRFVWIFIAAGQMPSV